MPCFALAVRDIGDNVKARLEEIAEFRFEPALQVEAIADDDELLPVGAVTFRV